MRYNLSGSDWSLYYKDNISSTEGTIPCTVPGNVEFDFIRAGLLPKDLHYGSNITLAEKFETFDYVFSKKFTVKNPSVPHRIVFEGVDTICDYFINGVKIGSSDNMFMGHTFTVDNLKEENILEVKVYSTVINASSVPFTAVEYLGWNNSEIPMLRRPAHTYGWDIMPRAVSAGIFKDVYIEEVPEFELTNVYFSTIRANSDTATVLVAYSVETRSIKDLFANLAVEVSLTHGDSTLFIDNKKIKSHNHHINNVQNPKLWWPKGAGEPNLYDLTILLKKDGEVVASYTKKVGIRKITLSITETGETMGDFCFIVNGERIFVRGVNWVPLSPYHSEDLSRFEQAKPFIKDSNVNCIRSWGGNLYESDAFFDFCDTEGIMVWQDFGFACSPYSFTQKFYDKIERETEYVIKRLRNHPSLAIWAGDNEIDALFECYGINPEVNVINRQVLKTAVVKHDQFRDYLPSSPYITAKAFINKPANTSPENHLWGARKWFKAPFYKDAKARFCSEMGVHGSVSVNSLKKFIPSDLLNSRHDEVWALHSVDQKGRVNRIEIMENHIRMLFGYLPTDYEEFCMLSQFVHSEGNKFFVENARNGKPYKTGLILWNLLDGWPQFSEALVDFYFDKKPGFTSVSRSYEPVLVTVFENNNSQYQVNVINDTLQDKSVNYKIYDADTNEVFLEGIVNIDKNSNKNLDVLSNIYFEQRCLVIDYSVDGKNYKNHFITGYPIYKKDDFIRWYKLLGL
ncbi:MAG: hypothetical protein J6B16_05710 [Clostridia bacterium]|nr:hypothetical protein [Clostridia bacterium]